MMYYRSIQSLAAASSIEENTVPNVQPTLLLTTEEGFRLAAKAWEAFDDVMM